MALGVPRGRALDATAMLTFGGVATPPLEPSILGVAHLADPAPLLIGTILLVGIALLRRRPLMALLVPLIIGGANLTTQLLKPALADVRLIELHGVGTRLSRLVAERARHRGDVARAVPRARRRARGCGRPARCSAPATRSRSATPSSRSAGTSRATSSAATSSRRRSRSSARRRSRRSRRAMPSEHVPCRRRSRYRRSWPAPAGCSRWRAPSLLIVAPGVTLDALGHPTAMAAGIGIAALGLTLTAGLALALRRLS